MGKTYRHESRKKTGFDCYFDKRMAELEFSDEFKKASRNLRRSRKTKYDDANDLNDNGQ